MPRMMSNFRKWIKEKEEEIAGEIFSRASDDANRWITPATSHRGGDIFPQRAAGDETVERFLRNMEKEKPVRFSPEQLARFTQNYSIRLGSGGFGVVYRGQFPDGMMLAVKVLNDSVSKTVVENQFMAEVSTIGRTYHKNLVRLYGYCYDFKLKALVYEYLENGSLDTILFGKDQEIRWSKFYEIAVGIAKGLVYLHEDCQQQQRIIHYDIKPGNILLDPNFCPKVADFGLAKFCNTESDVTLSGGKGTPGYAAPELWMPFPATYKCDVYSYGMMLFEIMRRRRNFDGNQESQQWFPRKVWDKFERGELSEIMVLDCKFEEEDRDKAEVMCMVALWCIQYLPEARPSMRTVLKILEGGVRIPTPPNPFQHLMSYGVEATMISIDGLLAGGSDFENSSTGITSQLKELRF